MFLIYLLIFELNVLRLTTYYRIKVIDSCDYNSSYSDTSNTILLSINDDEEFPILSWNAYQYWTSGVDNYEINVWNDDFITYDLVSTTDENTRIFIDETTELNQEEYCYIIRAFNRDDNTIISRSNESCIKTKFYLWIPNAFTPNDDGNNDIFKVVGKNVIEFEVSIFNRWGEQVFYSNDIYKGWDGTYKGQACPTDVYTYVIRAKGTEYQSQKADGTITLIR